jgi:hypothetical protein
MRWYVMYDGKVVRDGLGKKLTFEGTADEALAKARRRLIMKNPRLIEVFNRSAPAPDPRRGDEGRAWWMAHGL